MSVLEVEREDCYVVLRMNRPEKRNALSVQLLTEIVGALRDAARSPEVRGVVLTGSDAQFSTGVDLGEATKVLSPDEFTEAWQLWHATAAAIETSPLPVIAAINGYCLTGGLELALACDYRIAGRNARLGITSAKIGSVAGIGGTQRLPRLIGSSRAKRMLFTAEFLDADAALEIGLVDGVCDVEKTVSVAVDFVQTISANAPLSISWHKQAVNFGMEMDLGSALELERALCARAFATEDRMEGMTAFLERRAAVFKRR